MLARGNPMLPAIEGAGPVTMPFNLASTTTFNIPRDAILLIDYIEMNNTAGVSSQVEMTDEFTTVGGTATPKVVGSYTVSANSNLPVPFVRSKKVMNQLKIVSTGGAGKGVVHGRIVKGGYRY